MKLKILFLSANPHQDLSPDKEYRIIEDVISKSSVRDNILLVPKFAVRINDIISAINEVEPHIVHFTGHGTKNGELRLTDSSGDMDELLSLESLEKLFLTTKSVKLVFLSACHSVSQAKAISSHIDYVIGMKRQINDITAMAFAETFYGSIFADKSIDNAFNQAIVRLETEYKEEAYIPAILSKSKNTEFYLSEIIYEKKNDNLTKKYKYKKKYIFFLFIIIFISSLWYLFDNKSEKKEKPIVYKQLRGKIIDMIGNPIKGIKVILPNGESTESNVSGKYIFYDILTNENEVNVSFEYDENQYKNPDKINNNTQEFGLEYNPVQFRRLD